MSIQCFKCQYLLDYMTEQKIQRSDECPKCYSPIRCCKMCKYYDPKSYNECSEPAADRVVEKEKVNFCDFFVLASNAKSSSTTKEDLWAQANALFKK